MSTEDFWRLMPVLIGVLVAWGLARWTDARRERRRRTADFAEEYFSMDFLPVRAAVGGVIRQLDSGSISLERLAAGYWWPGRSGSFAGDRDTRTGLTEHESLTLYLDFYKRLGYAISRRLIDRRGLDILAELAWTAWIVDQLCTEVLAQAGKDGRADPSWVRYARLALETLPLPPDALRYPAHGWHL